MTRDSLRRGHVSFEAHVELLQFFLAHRNVIVERLQGLLNAQRKPTDYLRDGSRLWRHFDDCFFTLPGITPARSRLRGQLDDAHEASGFRPREIAGLYNRLVDPATLMMRAFHLWQQTRWPGRNGRIRFAQTLFNVYTMRCLELMSLRLWDDGGSAPGERLVQTQGVLDDLWKDSPADQPALVRDVRWLIPLAQSPATDELGVYFDVAHTIAETLPEPDRTAIHDAGVRMAGGHLRSQIRYHSTKKAVSLDESGMILSTRISNALDFALLIQDLVPLLKSYERACRENDGKRLELADAICQGISPDPELFLNRVELLRAYSMIEHLFIATESGGHPAYTPIGRRHVQQIEEYEALIGRVSKPLSEDCAHFRPIDGAYSPYGVLYGFSTNLVEHMAFKALQADAVTHFSLEDVFAGGDGGKLAWVNGWRKLPHVKREVEQMFDYPQQFAERIFDRIEQALRQRVARSGADVHTGRFFVVLTDGREPDPDVSGIPDLPLRYIATSDPQLVAANKGEYCDERQLLSDRREGKCLVSYQTPGGWVALSKAMLTDVLGAGMDAKIVGLPASAAGVLKWMCPGLVILRGEDPP